MSYKAKYIGGEKKLDIAILKIQSSKKFKPINFSTVPVNVGDIIFAAGFPFGFKQTYTMGIVSSKNVNLKIEGRYYNDLIQIDAAINQGNSGGPLLNIKGEIVGINSAIYSPSGAFAGVGFAIPAWKVREVIDEIVYKKMPERGWLGVSLIPTDMIMRRIVSGDIPKGGIINKVYDNSPAQKAGLKRGDIIVSVDGEDVENDEDLVYRVYYKKPGDKISITYFRNNKKYTTDVILAKRPENPNIVDTGKEKDSTFTKSSQRYNFNGVELEYINKQAVVVGISNDSPLRRYLEEGDIIVGVNNKKFDSYNEMIKVFQSVDLSDGVLFDMIRDGEPFYLSVQVK